MKIFEPYQIRNLEEKAVRELHLTKELLMENAAFATCNIINEKYTNHEITVLCGPGNNGGDGLAVARILNSQGRRVSLAFLYPPNYSGITLENYKRAKHLKTIDIENISYHRNNLIVDGLFGIGLNRTLDLKTTSIIENINSSDSPVLSLDIPSGIEGLNGTIWDNTAIKADTTVTFISYKLGMFNPKTFTYFGNIIVSTISLDRSFINSEEGIFLNTPIVLNSKDRLSHKCSNGKILTIAGSSSYFGAPYFASKAAILSGAGFSVLISQEQINSVCATLAPEIIYRTEKDLHESLKSSTSVVLGPGIGLTDRSRNLLKECLKKCPEKLILDADALTLLSEDFSILNNINKPFVITPHPGEMAKLTGKTVEEIEGDRINSALSLSKEIGAIVVLKGVFTVITTPKGEVFINNCSSKNLATAGSGDILCGIISGLSGINSLLNSVRAGVYIHGLAGKITEEKIGEIGVTASDILNSIPEAINKYKTLNL